jgi:hypothetical protein
MTLNNDIVKDCTKDLNQSVALYRDRGHIAQFVNTIYVIGEY